MEYIKLGNSELSISPIILGTWAIGGTMWGQYQEKKAIQAIETAIDSGINCIDTAPVYGNGHAEKLIGKVIKNKRDTVMIATKCGLDIENYYKKDLSPQFIEKDLHNSLKKLQTDYIDLYQCHWPDPDTPIPETIDKLQQLQTAGKIRYFGLSNFNAKQLREAIDATEIISEQIQYSLLDRSIEKNEIQDICTSNKLALLTYGSLGAGILSGKYKKHPTFGKKDCGTFFYQFTQEKYWHKIANLISAMEALAKDKKCSTGNIALAWLLARTGVTAAIVGAKSPQQVIDNLHSIKISLSREELAILDNLSDSIYDNEDINKIE